MYTCIPFSYILNTISPSESDVFKCPIDRKMCLDMFSGKGNVLRVNVCVAGHLVEFKSHLSSSTTIRTLWSPSESTRTMTLANPRSLETLL
uniref:Phlebovirus_G2 domain-containing protein n=1 Tax=Caenorhabditis tropicalis TaxID=1561998 RepID=A0A1I7TY69_9PELO